MKMRTLSRVRPMIVAASIAAPSAVSAQTILQINDGFTSTTGNWTSVITVEGQSGSFISVGGNPGTYASLIALTSLNNRTGTGFQYRGPSSNILLGSLSAQITLGADLKLTSTLPQTPAPEFVPMIIQGVRVYTPAAFIPAPTINQWQTIAPVTFNVSDFTNSTGIALDPLSSVTVGFWLRMPVAPNNTPGTGYGVGVDNVVLTVIPSPGAACALALGAAMITRRRRSR